MYRFRFLLTGTAIGLALGACTMTQSATKPGEPGAAPRAGGMLERLDADKDGRVTKAEFDAHRAAEFKAADKNGDGFVDRAEYDAHRAARHQDMAGGMFARLDKNGDGRIAADEFPQRQGAGRNALTFEQIDRNKNGVITAAEYRAAVLAGFDSRMRERMQHMQHMRGQHQGQGEHQGQHRGQGERSQPGGPGMGQGMMRNPQMMQGMRQRVGAYADEIYAAMDADKNGRVTKAEYDAAMAKPRLLLLADANKDGAVSREEFEAYQAKRQAQMPGPGARGARPAGGMFERFDANKDGKVSAEEWKAAGDAMFTRMDANKDGAITQDELRGPRRAAGPGEPGRKGEPKK